MTFEVMTGHRGICLDSTIERCAASCQSLVPVAESSMGEVVNTETDLGSHTGLLTPNERHFRRNNFPYPESWPGLLVEPGSRLSLSDLKRFETRELVVTLECAGNGRAFLDRPVREMQVRAVITQAGPGQARGYAWSGQGAVSAVEVSDDGGVTWFPAELKESAPPYGWTRWEAGWKPGGSGATQLLARAHDSAGNRQPLEQVWNTLGYCNNAVRPYAIS